MQKDEKKTTTPSELLTFTFGGKPLRVVIVENCDVWLVASDVAEALAYKDASHILTSLNAKNIRTNQPICDENGKQMFVTLIDVMGCGVLAGGAEPAVMRPFNEWVYQVLVRGTINDLRGRANQVAKPTVKQEIGFQTFVFGGNADVRVFLDEQDEPWFAGVDVCKALKYTNPAKAIEDHCEAQHITKRYVLDGANRQRETSFISESNLQRLIISSKKPEAKAFEKWIFEEIFPEIRKTLTQSEEENETQDVDFQIFNFENEQQVVRVFLDEKGNPWFVALDVCNVLGYVNQRDAIARHCEKDDVVKHYVIDKMGRTQTMTLINEGNLYRLIINSNMPSARKFEKWVFETVLPTIRKTGEYKMPTQSKTTDLSAEISPVLMDFIIQKVTEITLMEQQGYKETAEIMRKDIEDLKTTIQKFFSPVPAKPSYVYLAYNHNTGYYKPGKGDNPDGRAFALELGGSEIEVVSKIWFPSSSIALMWEKVFHKMFEKEARGREWFELNEKQVQFFKNMAEVVTILYA